MCINKDPLQIRGYILVYYALRARYRLFSAHISSFRVFIHHQEINSIIACFYSQYYMHSFAVGNLHRCGQLSIFPFIFANQSPLPYGYTRISIKYLVIYNTVH